MMHGTVMVTGGAGYIGSHVLTSLVHAGYDPIAVDDLSNGSRAAVETASALAGQDIPLIVADLTVEGAADAIMRRYAAAGRPISGVIHLAGRKAVGESVAAPLKYYEANVCATVRLLQAMQRYDVRSLVFSSSATVYGKPRSVPVTEQARTQPTNPYGRTKLMIENMLCDQSDADPDFGVAILRYFNPIGAHESGLIGEAPQGEPANVFPYITQVAAGRRDHLSVFGNDYDTPDGTGVRDYLHVMDLAEGHVLALKHIQENAGCLTLNLGTGRGVSVLELVRTFEEVSGVRIPLHFAPRRPGDIDAIWADPSEAARVLGWKAKRSLKDMCLDGWRWQSTHPKGYTDPVVAGIPRAAARAFPGAGLTPAGIAAREARRQVAV
jgi:UDP-glucose 4-epimerase